MRRLAYFIREAFKGLWRHGFMSFLTITTIFIVLFIMGLFALVGLNLHFAVGSLSESLRVKLVLKGNPTPADVQRVYTRLLALKGVKEARFVSRGEGLRSLAKELGRSDLLELLRSNPLPDVFDIKVKRASDIERVVRTIRSWKETEEVIYGREAARKLLAIQKFLLYGGGALGLILSVATFLVIFNTVRLVVYARREEIEIMRLVGATHWFIRFPFLFEGIILGGIGGALAAAFVFFSYKEAVRFISAQFPFVPLITDMSVLFKLCGAISIAGLLIGLIGGLFAVQKFLGGVTLE